jgi:hypothetical protein
VTVTEDVPGLWERYEDACETAEAARVQAVTKATKELDHLVNSISHGRAEPGARLKGALKARCDRKVKAAQEDCDAACSQAEDELMKALDRLA